MESSEASVGLFFDEGWVGMDAGDTTILFTPTQAREVSTALSELADMAESFNKPRN